MKQRDQRLREPRKKRLGTKAIANARGRMYMKAGLGWMPGFPLRPDAQKVRWMHVPLRRGGAPRRVELDRTHLREAAFSWNMLTRRFPRALPRLVGDAQAWSRRVGQMLELLKGAIHEGQPLPPSLLERPGEYPAACVERAIQVKGRHPALRPVVDAASWLYFTRPEKLGPALDWMTGRGPVLETVLDRHGGDHGIARLLRVCQAGLDERGPGWDALIRWLGDERAYTFPLCGLAEPLSELEKALKRDPEPRAPRLHFRRPKAQLGCQLCAWTDWVLLQDRRTRTMALALFETAFPPSSLDEWQVAWETLRELYREAKAILKAPATDADLLAVCREEVAQLQERRPPEMDARQFLADVRKLAGKRSQLRVEQLTGILRSLPERSGNVYAGPAFLHKLTLEMRCCADETRAWVRHLHAHLARAGPDSPLTRFCADPRYESVVDEFILEDQHHLFPAALRALERCSRRPSKTLTPKEAECIVVLVWALGSDEGVEHDFEQILRAGVEIGYLAENHIRCARELDRGRGDFGRILEQWSLDGLIGAHLALANRLLTDAGWSDLARDLMLDGQTRALEALGRREEALRRTDAASVPTPRPADPHRPSWAVAYPASLAALLATLEAIDPRAERASRRMLSADYPSGEAADREAAYLRRRLAEGNAPAELAQRLVKLERRHQNPPSVSEIRLKNLQRKLERRLRHAVVARWEQAQAATARRAILRFLDEPDTPEWLRQDANLELALQILGLSESFRRLGLRILKRRCGPPPWHLHDDPANRAFAQRMRERLIEIDLWLDGPPPEAKRGANGRWVTLSFEQDPLQILHMGSQFKTCLRPDSFNFFAALSNAADANKRVVYARDRGGTLVGRCLLALTSQGMILTYHPYSHDPKLGFEDMMREYAADLARHMGTTLAERGPVANLAATQWYDDGALRWDRRLDCLQPDSDFRAALAAADPNTWLVELEAHLAPVPVRDWVLMSILGMEELDERPELVRPLLSREAEVAALPGHYAARVAVLAAAAGEQTYFDRWWVRTGRNVFAELPPEHWTEPPWQLVLEHLIANQPAAALRLLRRSRPEHVRRDEDETCPWRRTWLAAVHVRFGSARKAAGLRPREG